jgi:catechol 2,3-dioxygenase-like lactoylglutathione lyase family enzyme
MAPRINLVTLGVADLVASRAFYEALGFIASGASNENVVFCDAGGVVLGLFGRHALAEDAMVPDGAAGFAAVTLAWNVETEAAVDAVMAHAMSCGARITKPAQRVFWGGYSGYFADPDGHLWEVAHNPFFPLDRNGRIELPPGGADSREKDTR